MKERRRGGEGDGLCSEEEEGNRRDRQLDSEEESSANTMADRRLSLQSFTSRHQTGNLQSSDTPMQNT